jgi:uncharacterized protein YtpQ (UPF0354 family)
LFVLFGFGESGMGIFDFLRGDDDQDRFAARVTERLKQRGWPHPIRYDRGRFELALGGEAGALYLGNIFRDWLKFPKAERPAQLDNAIAFVFEMAADDSWEAVREHLLPLIRPRAFFENTELGRGRDWEAGSAFPQKPLAGPLSIVLAIDRPSSMAMVGERVLREWGRSFDEVLEIALDNLRARSPCHFVRQAEGYYLSDFGDWHDASRILLPHLFHQLELRGDPVAIAIVREGLVVAGSEDAPALDAMAAFAEASFQDATRPISRAPLVFREGAWLPFEPQSPALSSLNAQWARQRVWDYGQQAELLERHFADIPLDRFLAPLEIAKDGSHLRTWTSWASDARALLPKADAVVLMDGDGRALPRLWQDVEAACGPFPVEGATYPQRYNCGDWPDTETLQRLAATTKPPAWLVIDGG